MKGRSIKHIWFDIEETLQRRSHEFKALHDELRYQSYAEVIHKTVTPDLKKEYEQLYKQYGSNSAVFSSLGLPSDHWQKIFNAMDKERFYKPDERIYKTLSELHKILPLSLFTNLKQEAIGKTLSALSIEINWFTHIISGDDVQNRKPALDGFNKIIQVTNLLPGQILYVGDRIDVDIIPAKQVGLKTCLVWSKSAEADYSFEQFEDILTIFN